MSSDPPEIELLLRANVTADEEGELREFFGRFGDVGQVRRAVGYRGPAEWIVLVALPLQAFLQNLGVLGSSDAYAGIAGLVKHLHSHAAPAAGAAVPWPGEAARVPGAAGHAGAGGAVAAGDAVAAGGAAGDAGPARGADFVPPLVLQDPRSKVSVLLEGDLPVAAYRQLVELDLGQFAAGPIVFDRARGRWNGLKG